MRDARTSTGTALARALALAGLLAAGPAGAVAISADAAWTLGGVAGPGDSQSGPPPGVVDIFGSPFDGTGNTVLYHTFGDTGGSFGSRVAGAGSYEITGAFRYEDVFSPGTYAFTFTVVPGELRLDLATGYILAAGEELFARYEIDIQLDGTTIASSAGEMSLGPGNVPTGFSLDPGSTFDLGGAESADQRGYAWGSFTDTVSFTVGAGDPGLLSYDLRTIARGNLPIACGGTGTGSTLGGRGAGAPGAGGACGSSLARSGDPFAVPEPGTALLLAGGLLILGRARRRS